MKVENIQVKGVKANPKAEQDLSKYPTRFNGFDPLPLKTVRELHASKKSGLPLFKSEQGINTRTGLIAHVLLHSILHNTFIPVPRINALLNSEVYLGTGKALVSPAYTIQWFGKDFATKQIGVGVKVAFQGEGAKRTMVVQGTLPKGFKLPGKASGGRKRKAKASQKVKDKAMLDDDSRQAALAAPTEAGVDTE
jgi:hypothetical protein